jgi:arylsulfatase A
MFYYRGTKLYAVRKGPYKAHFFTRSGYGGDKEAEHDPPLLYHLGHDPSEKYDVSKAHPEVIADIEKEVALHRANLERGEDQLAKRIGKK